MKKFWKPSAPSSGSSSGSQSGSSSSSTQLEKVAKQGLSKGVLSMKFMQAKAVQVQERDQVQKSVKVLNNVAWGDDLAVSTTDSSLRPPLSFATAPTEKQNEPTLDIQFFDPYAALPGRRSFGGCNKSVEQHYSKVFDDEIESRKTNDILSGDGTKNADDEMIARYSKLISLPRGPNQGMRPAKQQNHKGRVDRSIHQSQSQSSADNKVMKPIQRQQDNSADKFSGKKRQNGSTANRGDQKKQKLRRK